MCGALLRPTLNDGRQAKRALEVAANCNRKQRECGAFPPSLGARPALRFPRSPPANPHRQVGKWRKGGTRFEFTQRMRSIERGPVEGSAENWAGLQVRAWKALKDVAKTSLSIGECTGVGRMRSNGGYAPILLSCP